MSPTPRSGRSTFLHGLNCDRCDKTLLLDENVRYQVKIVVQAAYDPMEISRDELQKERAGDWEKLIRELENLSAEEAQDQVYRELHFDLCPECQRAFLRQPLGIETPEPEGP